VCVRSPFRSAAKCFNLKIVIAPVALVREDALDLK
jgi:hypothetical protein